MQYCRYLIDKYTNEIEEHLRRRQQQQPNQHQHHHHPTQALHQPMTLQRRAHLEYGKWCIDQSQFEIERSRCMSLILWEPPQLIILSLYQVILEELDRSLKDLDVDTDAYNNLHRDVRVYISPILPDYLLNPFIRGSAFLGVGGEAMVMKTLSRYSHDVMIRPSWIRRFERMLINLRHQFGFYQRLYQCREGGVWRIPFPYLSIEEDGLDETWEYLNYCRYELKYPVPWIKPTVRDHWLIFEQSIESATHRNLNRAERRYFGKLYTTLVGYEDFLTRWIVAPNS